MADGYLSLPMSVWIYEVTSFLTVSDILALRCVDKLSSKFITKLCAALVSSLDFTIEQVHTSLGIDAKERIERVVRQELAAKNIFNSFQIETEDFRYVNTITRPPKITNIVLELLICLAFNRTSCAWDNIKREISDPQAFLQSVKQKFNSEEVRFISQRVRDLGNSITSQEAFDFSEACGKAFTKAKAYIALQDLYQSPHAYEFIQMRNRANYLRRLQRVCAKVCQGLSETSPHLIQR